MKVERAQEILHSKDTVEVVLNGNQVWIDSIDHSAQTATVHDQGNPSEIKVVPVGSLKEV